jgi:hypothetical protein
VTLLNSEQFSCFNAEGFFVYMVVRCLPHFLNNWLTNRGEVVSLTRRDALYPQEDSWYSFQLWAE